MFRFLKHYFILFIVLGGQLTASVNFTTNIEKSLSNLDAVSISEIETFGKTLLKASQELRNQNKSKQEEQFFCQQIALEIISQTKFRVHQILHDDTLDFAQKKNKLIDLTYLSQGLIALVNVQERFGGRLAFHNLQHSLGVALGSAAYYQGTNLQFAAFCAGANHDAVMDYQNPPSITEKSNSATLATLTKFHTALQASQAKGETLGEFYQHQKALIKELKLLGEQKRNAGWKAGNSERASYDQMNAHLGNLLQKLQSEMPRDFFDAVSNAINGIERQNFTANAIRGTIPDASNFGPPGSGKRLSTISNVNIIPTPVQLAALDDSLRDKMIVFLDKILFSVFDDTPQHTFAQAVEDIRNTGAKYFNDPMTQFHPKHREVLGQAWKKQLRRIANEDPELFNYMLAQVLEIGTGAADLGSLLQKNINGKLVREEAIALITEENPYQAIHFFEVNRKLIQHGQQGLETAESHQILLHRSVREKLEIADEEYRGMLEFLYLTYAYIHSQRTFAADRIILVQNYIFEPMIALQNVLQESNRYYSNGAIINQCIDNFREMFSVSENISDSVIASIDTFIEESQTPESLSANVLNAISERLGPDFILHPSNYGYTEFIKKSSTETNRLP